MDKYKVIRAGIIKYMLYTIFGVLGLLLFSARDNGWEVIYWCFGFLIFYVVSLLIITYIQLQGVTDRNELKAGTLSFMLSVVTCFGVFMVILKC